MIWAAENRKKLWKHSNLWLKRQSVDERVDDVFAVAVVGEDEPEENCQ